MAKFNSGLEYVYKVSKEDGTQFYFDCDFGEPRADLVATTAMMLGFGEPSKVDIILVEDIDNKDNTTVVSYALGDHTMIQIKDEDGLIHHFKRMQGRA